MFAAITQTQWKWTRGAALLATLVGFFIPLASLQAARPLIDHADGYVNTMQMWGLGYSMLAGGAGLIVALAAWRNDHRGRHVYALSLPVPRWKYALMRYGAGALFLAAPVGGVLAGSLIVAASGMIPAGLHAYPIALTFRFAFATGVAYSIFFAISAGTSKSAGLVLGALASVLLVQYVLTALSSDYNFLGRVADFIFLQPGILSVFAGRWMLVDV